jgi:hypothetical protein
MKKLFIFAVAVSALSAFAVAEPDKVKVSHGSGKSVKFVTFTYLDESTGDVIEKKLPLNNGTMNRGRHKRKGETLQPDETQCLVNAVFELQDGTTLNQPNLDICGLDELLIE